MNWPRGAGTEPRSLANPPAAAPTREKSIAVLAFANFGGNRENEYFSDGITEELLNVLAKVPDLRVAARTSAFYFKGKNVPIPEIAQKLNVAYVVEGSVQKSDTRVKISAKLIDAGNGFQLWSGTFTREQKDIFALQDEIAVLIATNLKVSLDGAPRVAKIVDPEAHRLVLEGRHFVSLRTPEGLARAADAFQRAIAIAPAFAEAHAGLGLTWCVRASFNVIQGLEGSQGEMEQGLAAARRAIDLDPSLPEGHVAVGYGLFNCARFAEAERHLLQALALNAGSASVHNFLGLLYSCIGRLDRSIAAHERAAVIDPLDDLNLVHFARILYLARQYQKAFRVMERAMVLRTDVFIPHRGQRAQILLALGRKAEAVAEARFVRDHPDLSPRWQFDSIAVRVLLKAGLTAEATDYAGSLFARWLPDSFQRGFIHSAFGRFDEALPYLEKTAAQPARYLFWDETWDPWRDDPRFHQLLAKLGRSEHYQTARTTLAQMPPEKP